MDASRLWQLLSISVRKKVKTLVELHPQNGT